MESILDHKFHYTNSFETDLKKTFARVRFEIGQIKQVETALSGETSKNVLQIAARRSVLRTGANPV